MDDGQDWKRRSPTAMILRLLAVLGLVLIGAGQVIGALLSGGVDWPGRGNTHLTWANHPVFFVAAVLGWLLITVVLGRVSINGTKRCIWLVRHRATSER
jgi:hypothetical protein